MQEGEKHFSGKHKLDEYKVKVFILPNGLALGCSVHYASSISDLSIIQEYHEFYSIELKETRDERQEVDSGELSEEQRGWVVHMDKGYQWAAKSFRAVNPAKSRITANYQERMIIVICRSLSNRITVGNFFGRMGGLWNVIGGAWKCSETYYYLHFRLCVALTTFHLR